MPVFQCEVHFWTMLERFRFNDDPTGLCRYYLKSSNNDCPYSADKIKFLESRDVLCRPSSKRPEKLKYTINILEKLLSTKKVLKIIWYTRNLLQIWTSDLTCISCLVCDRTCDVERIHIDESIVQKLSSNTAADILSSKQYILFCYLDKRTIDYIFFPKQRFDSNKLRKLATLQPSVHSLEIPTSLHTNICRHFSASLHNNLVIFWFNVESANQISTYEKDVPNMVLLSAGGTKLEIITSIKTPFNLISATFSKIYSDIALCVEQKLNQELNSDFTSTVTRYNFSRNQFHLMNTYNWNSKERIVCCNWANLEEKLIICDSSGGLIIYNSSINYSISTKALIKPMKCEFHHSDTVFYVCSKTLDIQIFDMALNPLKLFLKGQHILTQDSLSISKMFDSDNLEIVESVWGPPIDVTNVQKIPECHDLIALTYKTGPLVMMSVVFGINENADLTPVNLTNEYLRLGLIKEAVNLLRSQNWNLNADQTFNLTTMIFNQLVKLDFNLNNEEFIQQILGSYYLPPIPLLDIILIKFKNLVDKMARRFFFYLLRNNRLEKAFLIATDISSKDLFMDLHYRASDLKESALADVCFKKAKEIYSNINERSVTGSLQSLNFDDDLEKFSVSTDYYSENLQALSNGEYWSAKKPTIQALEYNLRNILKNEFTTHL